MKAYVGKSLEQPMLGMPARFCVVSVCLLTNEDHASLTTMFCKSPCATLLGNAIVSSIALIRFDDQAFPPTVAEAI